MKINQGVAITIGAVWLIAITAVTGYEIKVAGHKIHSSYTESHYQQQYVAN